MIAQLLESEAVITSSIINLTPVDFYNEILKRIIDCINSYIHPIFSDTTRVELEELGIVGLKIDESELSFSKNSIDFFNEIKGIVIDLNRSNLKSLLKSDFYDRALLTFSGELIPLTAEGDTVISDLKKLEIIK